MGNPFAAEGAVASGLQVIDDVWFKLAGKPSEEIHCVSLLRKILSQVSHIQ